MANERVHKYCVENRWTGNLGTGTSNYRAYSRSYEISGQGKTIAIPGTSDPLFRGDPARYNPEELMLASLSSCHMLWVLHLCADAGIVVVEYHDEAYGEVGEHADGSGEFTKAVLRPKMVVTDPARIEDAIAIHARAHRVCAMARSVNFPVEHEPQVGSKE